VSIIVSARHALRSATSVHHQRVDAVFSVAILDDRRSYGAFLLAQAAAHLPVEEALERDGINDIIADWADRRRGDRLAADLLDLGIAQPARVALPAFDGKEALLGALYVLEGSRLGGTILKRSVPPDFPARFLGGVNSAAWQSLIVALDGHLDTDAKRASAINAAHRVFELFEASGRKYLIGI